MDKLRIKIQQINKSNLSQEEKSRQIFLLMNPNLKTEEKETSSCSECNFDYDNYGCKHYKRKCLMKADCCGVFVPCRFCHDENMDHKIDRFKTKEMKCKLCGTEQEVNKECKNCHAIMGEYYCSICKFWNDDKEQDLFHCDKCGICRKGKKEEHFHCEKCNTCLSISLKNSHRCIDNSLKNDCPVCGEDLFTSTIPVSMLKCGHSLHRECLNKYLLSQQYQCMLCKKSICDMTEHWEHIDDFLKTQEMPEEYKDMEATVFCNDCEMDSETSYHFIYNKCSKCNGYNTNIKNTFKKS